MTLAAFGFLHMTIADLLDIFLMALVIYVIFRWIRGSSAERHDDKKGKK